MISCFELNQTKTLENCFFDTVFLGFVYTWERSGPRDPVLSSQGQVQGYVSWLLWHPGLSRRENSGVASDRKHECRG